MHLAGHICSEGVERYWLRYWLSEDAGAEAGSEPLATLWLLATLTVPCGPALSPLTVIEAPSGEKCPSDSGSRSGQLRPSGRVWRLQMGQVRLQE